MPNARIAMPNARNFVFAALALLLVAGLVGGAPAGAGPNPANKVSASGSSTEVVGQNNQIVLLSEMIKTSKPTDLILGVTSECSIVTDLTTVGNDTSRAFGEVKIQVKIDGTPVPVATNDADNGRVVFCNRAYQRQTSMFDDEDATIKTFLATRSANAFNWLALNVGSGTHTVEVVGHFLTDASANAFAEAVVGNRTLVIEPVMAANNEEVTELE